MRADKVLYERITAIGISISCGDNNGYKQLQGCLSERMCVYCKVWYLIGEIHHRKIVIVSMQATPFTRWCEGVQSTRWCEGVQCMQEESFTKLVEKYLASIPRSPDAEAKPIGSLQPLPVEFPQGVVQEDVK